MDRKDCPLCCENRETLLSCPLCKEMCCEACLQKSLLLYVQEPQCIFCKQLLAMEWILENTSKTWVQNVFMEHWGEWKLEYEKNLLPDAQDEARHLLRLRALRKAYRSIPTIKQLQRSKIDLEERKAEARAKKLALRKEIDDLKYLGVFLDRRSAGQSPEISFGGFCPVSGCRGVVTDGECGLCSAKTCTSCGVLQTDGHQCDPNELQSFRMVQRHCKKCPRCSVPIFRISGCDHMWCTQCRTAFCWSSSRITNGPAHNPHYYEWMAGRPQGVRRNINEEIDQECVGIQYEHIDDRINKNTFRGVFVCLLHLHGHLTQDSLVIFATDMGRQYRDLRVRYLLNDIKEKEWKKKLIEREIKEMKKRSLFQVTELFVGILMDMLRMGVRTGGESPSLAEIRNLIQYFTDQYGRVLKVHGGGFPQTLKSFIQISTVQRGYQRFADLHRLFFPSSYPSKGSYRCSLAELIGE